MIREFIKLEVKNLKENYNTNDPLKIAKEKNIEVIFAPLKIWGMYKYIKKNKVIFVNSLLSELEQNIVLVHELGHAILHPKSECFFSDATNYLSKIKVEYEANLFLAEFSIDDIMNLN